MISIHALREERDMSSINQEIFHLYFNPRAPRGARPGQPAASITSTNFNPRAPRGARPYRSNDPGQQGTISIHALREERDCAGQGMTYRDFEFQSTRSARSATPARACLTCRRRRFQSTRSARSATTGGPCGDQEANYFNPRAPRGARPRAIWSGWTIFTFQSTRSARSATKVRFR